MAASVATHETEQPLAEPKAQKTVMIVEEWLMRKVDYDDC